MSRYNIFFPVHKGLRAALYQTSLSLQQTSFSNAEEAAIAAENVKTIITLFEAHAEKEDGYVLPAIAAYEPSVVSSFEAEHEEDHALGQSLENWLTALKYAVNPKARQTIGEALTAAFVRFSVFNLKHMAKEEDIINKILWRYYSDEELHGITQKIIGSIPPAEMMTFSRWMVRGMSNAEITGWLTGIKQSAPPPVCNAMLALAEEELAVNRWNTVQESITEGAMVAA